MSRVDVRTIRVTRPHRPQGHSDPREFAIEKDDATCDVCGAELDEELAPAAGTSICTNCRESDDARPNQNGTDPRSSPYDQVESPPVRFALWSTVAIAIAMLAILFVYRALLPTEVGVICLVVCLAIAFGAYQTAS